MKSKEVNYILLKLVILTAFFILFSIVYVSAADNATTTEEKGYSWLKTQLGDNCAGAVATDQIAFSLLAMAYDSGIQEDCKSSLETRKKDKCFVKTSSSSTCDIKSTALAVLALDSIGKDVNESTTWLLNKRESKTGLSWFLEIDADNATTCKIKVDGKSETSFTIAENKKITSGSSTCLSPAEENYFLGIANTCLNKNFTITCDKNFITTLLYKKPSSTSYYVSSETKSSSASGETEEKVESYCFKDSTTCSYEGTLWAALALAKQGEDVASYIPYLSAMADEDAHQLYFPSAFLYLLTDYDDYYSEIMDKQINGNHWKISSDEYYDTALGILALKDGDAISNVKDYLTTKQAGSGSWNNNNIRDTAFILYTTWSRESASTEPESTTDCSDLGYFCVALGDKCNLEDQLDNNCPGIDSVCCKTEPAPEPTCSQKGGKICNDETETCGSNYVITSDTNYCCLGTCTETIAQTNECEDASYTCSSSCSDTQDDVTFDFPCASSNDVCCMEKATKSSTNWWIIILLIILIILVVLAIIFRNQLKTWLFKKKSGVRFENGPSPINRPPMNMPPASPLLSRPRQIIPRPMPQTTKKPMGRPPVKSQGKSEKEKDFDETMKKLKEMSK
jgi:hypothetical protein